MIGVDLLYRELAQAFMAERAQELRRRRGPGPWELKQPPQPNARPAERTWPQPPPQRPGKRAA